jgi:hypothetical protein
MKISELNLAGTIAGTEVFPIVQGGETKKVSIADALAGAGGIPTLQQVTDVANGNITTTDVYNYFDIVNNYTRLTNDFNGGSSQTPGIEMLKRNSNGLSRLSLATQNVDPGIDDYHDSFIYFKTDPASGLGNQISLGSSISGGVLTQQLTYLVDTFGTFSLNWNYPNEIPKITYFDIANGNITSLEFTNSYIKTTINTTLNGLSLDFGGERYSFGDLANSNASVLVCTPYNAKFNRGLNMQLDDINIEIGDYNNAGNKTILNIQDYASTILATYNGIENGLKLNFFGDIYNFGNLNSGTNLTIDGDKVTLTANDNIYIFAQGTCGLYSNHDVSKIGDVNGGHFATTIGVDDSAQYIIASDNLKDVDTGNFSGFGIKIFVNGEQFTIPLHKI